MLRPSYSVFMDLMIVAAVLSVCIAGRTPVAAQSAEPKVTAVATRYCKYYDEQAGTDYVGRILGDVCGPPTAGGQVAYITCSGALLTVERAKLKYSDGGCERDNPVGPFTLAVLTKVYAVSADGKSVQLSYATKGGSQEILKVPADFIGSNVAIGKEVVVLPATGGQMPKALTDDFLRFKTLIDKGAFTDGQKTGLQLQLKQ